MNSYLTSKQKNKIILDLGLANNPCGANPAILKYKNPDLSHYQKDIYSKVPGNLIKEYWSIKNDDETQVLFNHNGSYGMGDEICRILFKLGYKDVYARALSFPNVYQWVIRHAESERYKIIESKNIYSPSLSTESILKLKYRKIKNNIFYIDYPQNPFGADCTLKVAQAVDYISNNGGIILLDVAFGEYIYLKTLSLIRKVLKTKGVVIGTLSKAQGLPASRIGYAIISKKLLIEYKKIDIDNDRLLLDLSQMGVSIIKCLFSPNKIKNIPAKEYVKKSARSIRALNSQLDKIFTQSGLLTLEHNPNIPIRVVYSKNTEDLQHWFEIKGIKTESLRDYSVTVPKTLHHELGHYVRLLTPQVESIQLFKSLLIKP